jgi:hypothetical protein
MYLTKPRASCKTWLGKVHSQATEAKLPLVKLSDELCVATVPLSLVSYLWTRLRQLQSL